MISLGEIAACQLVALVCVAAITAQARSLASDSNDAQVSAVIPSPNQDFGDLAEYADLQRTSAGLSTRPQPQAALANTRQHMLSFPMVTAADEPQASNEASVPVYVSPFNRAEVGATPLASLAPSGANYDHSDESSHAPPNYVPQPSSSSSASTASDLKTSASYGHHHHGGHHGGGGGGYGYGPSGWLDMGAWTGGKGSFGWYADYPVGGGKHHGYGRK